MNDEHSFNVEVAKVVGVNAAILIKSIRWWCLKNKANEKHYHDGLYWTYNTIGAFCELYPYLGKSAISRALKKLEDGGYIRTGNFNKTPYDRTRWYAITQDGIELCEGSAHFPKREMEETRTENQSEQSVPPIPVANQLLSSSERKKESSGQLFEISEEEQRRGEIESFNTIIDGFTPYEPLREALREFLKYRVASSRLSKKAFTNIALKDNLADLLKLTKDQDEMVKIVHQTIARGWSGFFKLRDDSEPPMSKKQHLKRDKLKKRFEQYDFDASKPRQQQLEIQETEVQHYEGDEYGDINF